MSLKVDLISNDEKMRALEVVLDAQRFSMGRDDPTYCALKALAHDLRGRMELPRSNVLGELERAVERTKQSQTSPGHYAQKPLLHVANTVVRHWPVIRQALEHFGEVSAE